MANLIMSDERFRDLTKQAHIAGLKEALEIMDAAFLAGLPETDDGPNQSDASLADNIEACIRSRIAELEKGKE